MYVMTMTGHERSAAALLALSAFTSTVASVALIPLFGLVGASIATSAGLIVWNTAMALFLWRRMRLLPGVLAMLRSPIEEAGGAERADALP
jgi:O-antigen/teichoic acid export membrane protein